MIFSYKGLNLYWGDIHGHSNLSDGYSSPDEYYSYGRDNERLDFSALTDHAFRLKNPYRDWQTIQNVAKRFNSPGRYVTFIGWEWSSREYGHHNVYFPGSSVPHQAYPALEYIRAQNKPKDYKRCFSKEALYRCVASFRGIIIAHHPSNCYQNMKTGHNWNIHNEELEPVVEIYSKWGSSEYLGNFRSLRYPDNRGMVQTALGNGIKIGIIAGTDTHLSKPGSNLDESDAFGNLSNAQGGLTAIFAEELTREKCFESLKRRRCYGTTGPKIKVELSVNDAVMGEKLVLPDPSVVREITVAFQEVSAGKPIRTVEIVKNNHVVYRQDLINSREGKVQYTDRQPIASTDCYYTRVIQLDEERAWSSPIWVTVD